MKYCIYVFLILTLSCKGQKKVFENQLKKCVLGKINSKNVYKKDPSVEIDIYSILRQTEKSLKTKGYLKNYKSKKEYFELVDKITNGNVVLLKKLNNDISEVRENNNYNGVYIGNIVLQSCPHFIGEKTKDSTLSIKKQIKTLDKLYAFDPYDPDNIKEVIASVSDEDFKNVIYRVPVYVIISEYISYKLRKSGVK